MAMNNNMAEASEGLKSGLNPNAPLFIPAALRQVEDFSPEWYELVKTSTWFREHWFSKQQEEEYFDGHDDDVLNMLPDSFDLGIDDELSDIDGLEEAFLHQANGHVGGFAAKDVQKTGAGLEMDGNAITKTMNGVESLTDAAEHREDPVPTHRPQA